jgi:hypothetical protein
MKYGYARVSTVRALTSLFSANQEDECTLLEKVEKLQGGFIGTTTQDGGSINADAS